MALYNKNGDYRVAKVTGIKVNGKQYNYGERIEDDTVDHRKRAAFLNARLILPVAEIKLEEEKAEEPKVEQAPNPAVKPKQVRRKRGPNKPKSKEA